MKRKLINAVLFGSLSLGMLGLTAVSCSDYDGDIENLQKQITTNATNLDQLVKENLGNLEIEVDALKTAQSNLADAYKAADDEAKKASIAAAEQMVKEAADKLQAAIDAANEKISSSENKVQALLEAQAALETAATDAANKANSAYALAEQAKATADSNKEQLGTLSSELETIKKTLDEIKENGVLGEEVKALTERVSKLETGLSAQQTALTEQQETIDKLSAAQKDSVENINKRIEALKALVDGNNTTLTNLINQQIQTVQSQVTTNTTAIADIKRDFATKEALSDSIAIVRKEIEANESKMDELSSRLDNVSGLVNVLFTNLSNLVTGLILQDVDQVQFYYDQVLSSGINKTGWTMPSGNPMSETVAGTTTVYFPYKGAADAQTLTGGRYNVEQNGGKVYLTINPTTIVFDESVPLKMENSLEHKAENEAGRIEIGKPQVSTNHLVTRASGPNGFYYTDLTFTQKDASKKPADYEGSYAFYVENPLESGKAKNSALQNRRVYSKYELNLKMAKANVVNSVDLKLTTNISSKQIAGVDYVVDGRTGKFEMTPTLDKNCKATDKIFRKYVEIVDVSNNKFTMTQAQKDEAKRLITKANADALSKVITEGKDYQGDAANGFNSITLDIDKEKVGKDYNGYTITLRYYAQNYNGSIVGSEKKVLFTEARFKENEISVAATPTAKGTNTTTAKETENFFKLAKCVNGAEEKKIWTDETKTIQITADGVFSKVGFYDASNPLKLKKDIALTAKGNGSEGSVSTNATELNGVKNMLISYVPANLVLNHVYTINILSLDKNGNTVSEMKVKFTMKYPNTCGALINPNPAFFLGEVGKGKLNNSLLTAWASSEVVNNVTYAYYDLNPAFNNPKADAHGCLLRFDLANKESYGAGKTNAAYLPSTALPFKNSLKYTVPVAAVKFGAEHTYNMQVAVEYFGVTSLWSTPEAFRLVYKSPIAYTVAEHFSWNQEFSLGYPNRTITITDAHIKSDDPSEEGDNNDVTFFGQNRDKRIKSVSVKLMDTQYESLFKSYSVTNSGIVIATAENTGTGTGAISNTKVTFRLLVEDYFGNTVHKDFTVTVNKNLGQDK